MREKYRIVDADFYDRDTDDDFRTLGEAESEVAESARYSERVYIIKVTTETVTEYVTRWSTESRDIRECETED